MSKIRIIEGNYQKVSASYGIVVAKFNSFIVDRLLDGALAVLAKNGVPEQNITVVRVPGAFEIPLAATKLASMELIDSVITLGAVIRGGTPHFEYVAGECASGVRLAGQQSGKPVIFGVLTVDNIEQAVERSGSGDDNKGAEAAMTAIEMVSLMRQLQT